MLISGVATFTAHSGGAVSSTGAERVGLGGGAMVVGAQQTSFFMHVHLNLYIVN